MIVTVTMNPAVDQTAWVERLEPGEVHRVLETHLDPAGKGINVSRMAHRLGWPTIAFGFVAGEIGNLVARALDAERVQHHFVRISGQTRVNTTLVERENGRASSFYAPGPAVPPDAAQSLDALLRFWIQAGRVLVLAGSLPPGIPANAYADYVRVAKRLGVKVIVDSDGNSMREAVAAVPDLIKPNVAEAERLLERKLPDLASIRLAARELAGRGIGTVIISMGADGALCIDQNRTWHVHPLVVQRLSTVGSGDSMIAGLAVALARGGSIEEGLRLGTAAGAATAMTPGTALGTSAEVAELLPRVRLEELP
ncbi:MAG: fructose-phosphate kinase [Myxococcaceae bacterium]|nr:fructose-phosphate kinase [Myxococcaceae bacterium]